MRLSCNYFSFYFMNKTGDVELQLIMCVNANFYYFFPNIVAQLYSKINIAFILNVTKSGLYKVAVLIYMIVYI